MIEAMKQAMEDFKRIRHHFDTDEYAWEISDNAITSLRQAIEQFEKQERPALKRRLVKIHDALSNHIGDTDPYIDDDMTDEEICESEPVFWAAKEIANLIGDAPWTEYTTPQPKREWVGLTVKEANELWESTDSDWELMKRVEAKLKEKNT